MLLPTIRLKFADIDSPYIMKDEDVMPLECILKSEREVDHAQQTPGQRSLKDDGCQGRLLKPIPHKE